MSNWPKVAVIVLNWNGVQDTVECLLSLKAITSLDYGITVIDNASSGDDVQRLRQRFGDAIHLIQNDKNYGFAGGCNIGIRHALSRGADYVLLLNNDAVVDPAFLRELVSACEELSDAAAVCPKIYHYDRPDVLQSTGGRVSPWRGTARQVGRHEVDRGQYDLVAERDYADGACMLIGREALERIGLLDEDYFAYWEETDWCTRAREMGFKCYYVPSARIWHRGARSRSTRDYQYLFRRSAFLFLRKRKPAFHLVTAILFHLLVLAPLYIIRHPTAVARIPTEARALRWHLTNRARTEPAPTVGPKVEP